MAHDATRSDHRAILVALLSGPLQLVQLGRELARLTGQDFGAQLQDLARRGWLRGPRGFFCDYELTEAGRRAARDKLDPWRADTPELGEMMRRL